MGQFEGEDVVLKKDIIRRDRDFLPTESEWHARHTEQIFRSGVHSESSGSTTIFTVPDKKTFFITYICLSIVNEGTVGNNFESGQLAIGSVIGTNSTRIANVYCSDQSGNFNEANIATNLSHPIKVESGETINVSSSGTDSQARAVVIGWLERKEITQL